MQPSQRGYMGRIYLVQSTDTGSSAQHRDHGSDEFRREARRILEHLLQRVDANQQVKCRSAEYVLGRAPVSSPEKLEFQHRAVQRSQLSPICNSFQVLDATGVADDSAGRKSLNLCEATESMGGRLEVLEVLGAVSGAARHNP